MKDINKYLIKRTLFLIITIFVIGTLHQCAKAYTWDDLYEFCYNNQGNSERTTQNNAMSYFVTIANDMKTSLTTAGYDLDDYNTFVIKIGYSQSRYNVNLCMVKNAESFSRWNSNANYQFNNTEGYDYLYMQATTSQIPTYAWNSSNNATGTGTYKNNTINVYDSVGLFKNASTTFLSGTGLFAQNYYNAITSNDITITNNSTIPFNIQQGIVGLAYDINNISYKLYTQSDTYIADLTAVYTSVNSGKSFNLLLDTFNLINTGYYKINMYNSDEVIYTSDIFKITKSRTPQARRYYK